MNIGQLDGRQIESIVLVSQLLSYEKAAQELSYTNSAISKHISSAEKILGAPIFKRKGRSAISLTPFGEAVMPLLDEINQRYLLLSEFAANNSATRTESLTIMSPNSLSTENEDKIIAHFNMQYPDVVINYMFANERDAVEHLLSGEADAGLISYVENLFHSKFFARLIDNPDFDYFNLTEKTPLTLALKSNHPALHNGKVDLADLKNETFLFKAMYSKGEDDWKYNKFVSACYAAGFEPKTRYIQNLKNATIFSMVSYGIGISPVMRIPEVVFPNVSYAIVSPTPYYCTSCVYYMKSSKNKALNKLITFLKNSTNNSQSEVIFESTEIKNNIS